MKVNNLNEREATPQLRVRCNLRAGQTTTGGTVSGVYYPDMSGTCPGSTPPTGGGTSGIVPSPSGGATINGVYYPNMSGTCSA